MSTKPLSKRANGEASDGRDAGGRFVKGCAGGPGNPYARKAAALRKALYEAITPGDIRAAVKALAKEAKAGNVIAARELLDRAVGKPLEADLLDRLSELESRLQIEGR